MASSGPDRATGSGLTVRESEVLELVSRGWTNAQVAADLGVTIHAVKFHLASVFRKLGVRNRIDASVTYVRLADHGQTDGQSTESSWT
jgi:DNA-binding NarL/FixJ family response regulator